MNRLLRVTVGAAAVAASSLASASANAQVACDTLPNPIIVSGSSEFEPLLKQFAVKIAAESSPATIITLAAGGQSTSCAAIKGLVEGTDFGGLPGRYYTLNGDTIVGNLCMLPSGQTTQVAISEVFYESCANVPQPKPADVADVPGPVYATVFVVPKANTRTLYVTREEARTIYGCGVSVARTVAGAIGDPRWVFCRRPDAGTQITLDSNLGLSTPVFPWWRGGNNA